MKPEMFDNDPFSRIPKTNEEAIENLKWGKPAGCGDAMVGILVGIFRVERAMGFTLLQAYEDALLAGAGLPARHYKAPSTKSTETNPQS